MIVQLVCPACKVPFTFSGTVYEAPDRCHKCGRSLRLYNAYHYEVIPDQEDLFGAKQVEPPKKPKEWGRRDFNQNRDWGDEHDEGTTPEGPETS